MKTFLLAIAIALVSVSAGAQEAVTTLVLKNNSPEVATVQVRKDGTGSCATSGEVTIHTLAPAEVLTLRCEQMPACLRSSTSSQKTDTVDWLPIQCPKKGHKAALEFNLFGR
jgi:hypothetical protein